MSDSTGNTAEPLTRRQLLSATGAGGLAMAAGCLDGGGIEPPEASASAAWLYFAEADDQGWTSSHDSGRQATEARLDDFEGAFTESVEDVESVASQYAEAGYDVIFGLSAGFTDPMASASEQYPDTAFEVASGADTGENYGAFYVKLYQARYLAGYAAGMITENDRIGYVAANPVSTVYQDINGFASGVQDANEDATIFVRWTDAWYDPGLEGENAQALIDDEDVDVMIQHQDSPAAASTAADNEVWASGYAESAAEFAGDYHLTTAVFNWEEAYIPIIEAARDGEWEAGITFPGIETGAAEITEFGPEVPDEIVDEVHDIRDEMIEGDADEIVWGGSEYEDWSDEEILFNSETFIFDNIEGDEA